MGLKSQFQIKIKQREKRRKRRNHLSANGKNLAEYFYGKYFLKTGSQG